MKRNLRLHQKLSIWGIIAILCISFSKKENNITHKEIIMEMLVAIKNIKTLTYISKTTERINGGLFRSVKEIKYHSLPVKCYILMKSPNQSAELLFVEGANNNKAIYNPNGFPYFKLNLDPMGSLMRKNNHHTIYEVGFKTIAKIITKIYKEENFLFINKGEIVWNNRKCYRFLIKNNDFKLISHIVKKNETIRSIAQKYSISEYMILELNKELDDFDNDLILNQKILIPTTYAKNIELYIDKKTLLPIFQKIVDDKGLYEQYEYTNLVLNPIISDEEFIPEIFNEKK